MDVTKAADPSPQASPEPRLQHVSPAEIDLYLKQWLAFGVEFLQHKPIAEDALAGLCFDTEVLLSILGGRKAESRVTAPVGQPVAYRVKDFADGWILHHTLDAARDEAAGCGNLIQALYTGELRAALASPPQIAQPERERIFELEQKIRAADAVMKAIDRQVEAGLIDSCSEIADRRLDYSQPHTYAAQPSQVSAEQFWKEWWTAEKQDLQWNTWKGIAIKFAEAYRAAHAATPPQLQNVDALVAELISHYNSDFDTTVTGEEFDAEIRRIVLKHCKASPPQPQPEELYDDRHSAMQDDPEENPHISEPMSPKAVKVLNSIVEARVSEENFERDEIQATLPLLGPQRWIPVSDKLPRIGEYVLVVIGGVVQFNAANFSGQVWDWSDQDADCAPKEAVTHWQPLPAPPGAEATPAAVEGLLSAREIAVWILANCAAKYVNPVGYSQSPQDVIDLQIHMAEVKIAEAYASSSRAKE